MLEDDTTITKHKRFMELELQKSVPSLDLVLDRMNRTFGERRAVISKEIVSVEKICQEYPALKIADMVRFFFICLMTFHLTFYPALDHEDALVTVEVSV